MYNLNNIGVYYVHLFSDQKSCELSAYIYKKILTMVYHSMPEPRICIENAFALCEETFNRYLLTVESVLNWNSRNEWM